MNSAETAANQAQLSYDTARQNEANQVPLAEQQVANALLVPSRAIITANGAKYVTLVQGANKQSVRVPVTRPSSAGTCGTDPRRAPSVPPAPPHTAV